MKIIFALLLFLSPPALANDFAFYVDNSMMNASFNSGSIDLGLIDPFNPQSFCNNFISPNTCNIANRETLNINLDFAYFVEVINGTSLDVYFSVDNGNNGSSGEYTNVSAPMAMAGLLDQASGSFSLTFDIPLFGPNSATDYGMVLDIDVVLNP